MSNYIVTYWTDFWLFVGIAIVLGIAAYYAIHWLIDMFEEWL